MTKRRRPRGGYQITTHMAVAFLLLFLFVGSAYLFVLSGSNKAGEQQQLLEELALNQQRWASTRPSAFDYVVVRDCECPNEVRAPYKVREYHDLKEAQFPIDIESATGESLSKPISPIWLDDLFVIAEEALVENKKVALRFDRRFGFVAALTIHAENEQDVRYVVRDFENLSPQTP